MDATTLPDAARCLGRSAHSLRWLLRRRPDLAATITRVGGRKLFTAADIDRVAAAYAARTRRRTTPEPTR